MSYSFLKDEIWPRLFLHPTSKMLSFVLKQKSFYISKGFEFQCILTIYAKWRKMFKARDDIDLSQYLHHLSILKICCAQQEESSIFILFLLWCNQKNNQVKGIPDGELWQNHNDKFSKHFIRCMKTFPPSRCEELMIQMNENILINMKSS